ncbi:MAG: DUF4157 domain-containing protein [Myxococcales bacterium]|nr:DUF4157 domain-containing protein [Myxococcales bacterium]
MTWDRRDEGKEATAPAATSEPGAPGRVDAPATDAAYKAQCDARVVQFLSAPLPQTPSEREAASAASAGGGGPVQHAHPSAGRVTGDGGLGLPASGEALPHGDRIRSSFGAHAGVLDGVTAHVGGEGGAITRAQGAQALAVGDHVAFAAPPDLHLAAHEAAHVAQQQQGVQFHGAGGDAALEAHADQVADRVVAGRSAEDLLAPGPAVGARVQRKVANATERDMVPELDRGIEQDLIDILKRPVAKGDQDDAEVRAAEFDGFLMVFDVDVYASLWARLSVDPPPASDKLATAFHHTFHSATRTRILKRIERAAREYKPVQAVSDAAGADVWKQLAPGETTKAVHEIARVSAEKGLYLRATPAGEKGTLLPFGTMVIADRETSNGWYHVVAPGMDGSPTGEGFIESHLVVTDPPEPTAGLYQVKPGDMLKDIAAQHYPKFVWGADARLYVQAIYHANHGRRAVYRKGAGQIAVDDKALSTKDNHEAFELWSKAQVREGHMLWVPSVEFVDQLRASGQIVSGSDSYEVTKAFGEMLADAWDATAGAIGRAIDWAQYAAGFVVGLLEGAWGSLVDLFKGVGELASMIWSAAKMLIGDFSEIKQLAKDLSAAWKNKKEIMQSIATDFMEKWEAKDDFDRGNFQGEFLGYVMMLAFITLVTMGEGTVIAGAGRFGAFIKVIQAADAAGSIGTYVGKLRKSIKLPAKAVKEAEEAVGKNARKVVKMSGGDTPDAPHGHGGAPDVDVDAPHVDKPHVDKPAGPDPDAPRKGGPYKDPDDPLRETHQPIRTLADDELAHAKDLHPTRRGKDLLRPGSRAIGKVLKTRGEGETILHLLATGDKNALAALDIDDIPKKLKVTEREWALVETRDGFVMYMGDADHVSMPPNVRSVAHTHPTHAKGKRLELDVPDGQGGLDFTDIAADPSKVKGTGLLPSAMDLHTVADGTEHTLHTQFVMDWDGTITNAVDGDTRPRVQVHISKSRVVRYSERQKVYFYQAQIEVSASGQSVWSGDFYGQRGFQTDTDKISFKRFGELDRPPPASYVDPQ